MGAILSSSISVQRHICAEGKEITWKSLKNYKFMSVCDVNIPCKVSPDLFENLFQVSLHFFSKNVLFLIGGLYNTMIHTHPMG